MNEQLLDSIYSGVTEASPWHTFLNRMCDLCRAQTVTFIISMPRLGETGLVFSGRAIAEYQRQFVTRFFNHTPFHGQPLNRAFSLDDLMDRATLQASEYYRDLLVPAATEYVLGLNVACSNGEICLLTVSRTREQGNFGPLEKELLESMAAHLSRALSLYVKFHDLRHERAVFSDALDHLGIGTIVLDKRGRLVCANRTADTILEESGALRIQGDRVRAANAADHAALAQLLEAALDAHRRRAFGECAIMKLALPGGERFLHVLVRPSIEPSAIENSSAPAACLFVSVPGVGAMPSSDVIRQLFGFTRAEGTVVRLLLEGLVPKEIAHELDISLSTVRTHIKSIFTKAGVGRQSELVSSVLRSIALLA